MCLNVCVCKRTAQSWTQKSVCVRVSIPVLLLPEEVVSKRMLLQKRKGMPHYLESKLETSGFKQDYIELSSLRITVYGAAWKGVFCRDLAETYYSKPIHIHCRCAESFKCMYA